MMPALIKQTTKMTNSDYRSSLVPHDPHAKPFSFAFCQPKSCVIAKHLIKSMVYYNYSKVHKQR